MRQYLGDGVHLPVGGHLQSVLENVGLVLLRRLHGDLLRVPLVHPRDVHDLPGDGGGEHPQILPAGDLVQNPGHIVDKAHVQHPIRLVQYHGLHAFQADGAPLHVIAEPSRRRHHDLRSALQRVDLLADGLTAVQAHQTHALVANGDVPHFVGDLHGKLAGGCQDHRLHLLALPVNALDNGDAERHGLAGAGRGLGDDVLPRQHGRDAPRLYGGADGVMLIAYGAHGGV